MAVLVALLPRFLASFFASAAYTIRLSFVHKGIFRSLALRIDETGKPTIRSYDKTEHWHFMTGWIVCRISYGVHGGHCISDGVFEVFICVVLRIIVVIVVIAFSIELLTVFISALWRLLWLLLRVNGHFRGVTERHSMVH